MQNSKEEEPYITLYIEKSTRACCSKSNCFKNILDNIPQFETQREECKNVVLSLKAWTNSVFFIFNTNALIILRHFGIIYKYIAPWFSRSFDWNQCCLSLNLSIFEMNQTIYWFVYCQIGIKEMIVCVHITALPAYRSHARMHSH